MVIEVKPAEVDYDSLALKKFFMDTIRERARKHFEDKAIEIYVDCRRERKDTMFS